MRSVRSHVSTLLGIFREKIWSVPKNSKNIAKTEKLKVIIHNFRLSRGPIFEHNWMPYRDMRCHWKGVTWLETNIWMYLRSFRDYFGFPEKWTNGVFKIFSRQCKWCQVHAQRYKSRQHSPRNYLGENMTRPRKVQKCRKNSQNWRL